MFFDESPQQPSQSAPTKHIFQVSQLNTLAKQTLETEFAQVWVEGEISNLSQPQSGHIYLTLKDSHAQVRGAFFKQSQRNSRIKLSNGQQVLIRGKVSLYAPRGDYQLIISHIEPAGAGQLQQAFDQLKHKLQQEGLFDESLKKALPTIPKAIGIVTSATGAALHDIINVLGRRFPWSELIIYPTLVQGATAAPAIVKAIQVANARKETEVLIVGRGGGSLEDLWPFNEEIVARAIIASELPIISAVGHQTDFTIADFVADVRAPTPSAAAEISTPDWQELYSQFSGYEYHLTQLLNRQIHQHKLKLDALARHIKHPRSRLQEQMQRLDSLEMRLTRGLERQQQLKHQKLELLRTRLKQANPALSLKQNKQRLAQLEQQLLKAIQDKVKANKIALDHASKRLVGIGPQRTLERGFVIAQNKQGQVVKSKSDVKNNESLTLRFKDGTLEVNAVAQP